MTLDEVDWILRMPSDELQMSPETLAQLQSAITGPTVMVRAEGVHYRETRDDNGRQVKVPHQIADRRLTLVPGEPVGFISIRVRGQQVVAVYFATP